MLIDLDREDRAAFGIEQEHCRAVVGDGEVLRLTNRAGLHLRGLERRRDRVGTPYRRMEEQVPHRRAVNLPSRVRGSVRTTSLAAAHPGPQRTEGRSTGHV